MSVFNQKSFGGGMNLRVDDTRLKEDEYRVAFNVRNNTDSLVPVLKSIKDYAAPAGIKQGMLTFGDYVILFVAGSAYYRKFDDTGWQKINGFAMSTNAPRYWTEAIPVSITNYRRQAKSDSDVLAGVTFDASSAFGGNQPGLLVQDNINQPQFIFINSAGNVACKVTQSYDQWSVVWDTFSEDGTPLTTYSIDTDKREYVPIGNVMAYVDGVLWIASQDKNKLYRSVSGRPLDFGIIVDTAGVIAADAEMTAYTVGVGGISTLRVLSDNSLFVAAGNANFAVSKNMTPGAPTICGEYTFIRRFLFNATCINDRCIIDSLGDTRFIDITGVRSFNAVLQLQNEGRNSAFTATVVGAFTDIVQSVAAAILYNNDELYAINSVFGPAIIVYDSIQQKWVGLDIGQTGGRLVKQLAKIESSVQKIYAITDDDQLYELYADDEYANAGVQTGGINAVVLQTDIPINNLLQHEIKPVDFRCVLTNIRVDISAKLTVIVNNQQSGIDGEVKNISYAEPLVNYNKTFQLPQFDSQMVNIFWSTANAAQGWKTSYIIEWTGGAILTQLSASFRDETPKNPLLSQVLVK